MKLFEWSEDLATGIQIIDEQHREIGKRINVFLKHCAESDISRNELCKTFAHLHMYTIEHFGLEETLMQEYGYQRLASHQRDHGEFRVWVEETEKNLKTVKLDSNFVLAVNYRLVDHLQSHFRMIDKRMSEFLIETAEREKSPKLLRILKGLWHPKT